MKLSAKPSLNGNTERDFQDAYMALNDAKKAVETAFRKVLCDVANGRNYQHLGAGQDDEGVICDRRRVQASLTEISGIIGTLQSALIDTLEV